MDVRQIRPRLWHWSAPHPDWTPDQGGDDGWDPDVGCYAYVTPEGRELLLFDPLVPQDADLASRFWSALDADVEHHGAPHVLITLFWHARSAQQIHDRYERARVWAAASAEAETAKRTIVTDTFVPGDPLPANIDAVDAGANDEVVYWLPEHRGVVPGDSLVASGGGPMRVWQGGDDTRRKLRPLLERPVELVLLTHGDPVLDGGRDALAKALEA